MSWTVRRNHVFNLQYTSVKETSKQDAPQTKINKYFNFNKKYFSVGSITVFLLSAFFSVKVSNKEEIFGVLLHFGKCQGTRGVGKGGRQGRGVVCLILNYYMYLCDDQK